MPRGSNLRSQSTNPAGSRAHVVEQRVHVGKRRAIVTEKYSDTDEPADEWIEDSDVTNPDNGPARNPSRSSSMPASSPDSESQLPSVAPSVSTHPTQEDTKMTVDGDAVHVRDHKPVSIPRNIDNVNFGQWQIRTWYFSPYPLTEPDAEDRDTAGNSGAVLSAQSQRMQPINRPTIRPQGRASDLLSGGSRRMHLPILWVCDRCFKYMADGASWELHVKGCPRKHPPGRKVYQRGAHTIWEVDGAKEKLYCQNLSLFGKLFIDVKTLFFDCDNFLFYLMTDADSQRDRVLGFFSKEKVSYDDYNLACIITFPPYQRQRYGMLMIEFSYELSRRAGKVGTPERPLSDLGLRSYLTYWISTLIRFFRRLLTVLPRDIARISSSDKMPVVRSPSRELDDVVHRTRRKRIKGWDGESAERHPPQNPVDDHLPSSLREIETSLNFDGSATSHVVVRCTLRDIAKATDLRPEDAAFALNECGLLSRRQNDGDASGDVIAISREMVETVAKERNVKELCLDQAHVLL